jgi:hypothetical protein
MLFNYAFSRELHQHGGASVFGADRAVHVGAVGSTGVRTQLIDWMYLIYNKSTDRS